MPRRTGSKTHQLRLSNFNPKALETELHEERRQPANTAADKYPHGVVPSCGLAPWECTLSHGPRPDTSDMRPTAFLPTESDLLNRQFDRDIMGNRGSGRNLFSHELGL